jgi:hypothetical protein
MFSANLCNKLSLAYSYSLSRRQPQARPSHLLVAANYYEFARLRRHRILPEQPTVSAMSLAYLTCTKRLSILIRLNVNGVGLGGVSNRQMARLVCQYLQANVTLLDKSAALLTSFALLDAYPCK